MIFFNHLWNGYLRPTFYLTGGSENAKFCDFSPEIKSTQFRGIITEARDENPVSELSMTKDSEIDAQNGSTVVTVRTI